MLFLFHLSRWVKSPSYHDFYKGVWVELPREHGSALLLSKPFFAEWLFFSNQMFCGQFTLVLLLEGVCILSIFCYGKKKCVPLLKGFFTSRSRLGRCFRGAWEPLDFWRMVYCHILYHHCCWAWLAPLWYSLGHSSPEHSTWIFLSPAFELSGYIRITK